MLWFTVWYIYTAHTHTHKFQFIFHIYLCVCVYLHICKLCVGKSERERESIFLSTRAECQLDYKGCEKKLLSLFALL